MDKNKVTFREAVIDPKTFTITWELIPGRGAMEESQQNILKKAELAAKGGKVNAITITDNPGGKPAILSSSIASEIFKLGIEPLIHFSCKDRNRNILQSEFYSLERAGLNNILVMTGDYPTEGYTGRPKPVFDIDSVQALKLIESMNKGEIVQIGKKSIVLGATDLFTGAVVSPFKNCESELMTQYYKLEKKIQHGAKFIYTQLGYNPRKFEELRKYMQMNNLNVPLIGNIFVMSLTIAKIMNMNQVPGCVISDDMVRVLEEEKEIHGTSKELRLLRAAKLYAVLKGLKYDGVNISGFGIQYSDLEFIIEKGEEMSDNWQELAKELQAYNNDGFYYFEKDDSSGLNSSKPVDTKKLKPKKFSITFNIFKLIHFLFFTPKSPLYGVMKFLALTFHNTSLEKLFSGFEYGIKHLTNDCRTCGDCAMYDVGYLCPMSQCPKQQRNGSCGGSFNGWCEVYPDEKKCIYVRAYERLKFDGEEAKLKGGYIRPCNWDLYQTSSWYNYYTGKDYTGSKEDQD